MKNILGKLVKILLLSIVLSFVYSAATVEAATLDWYDPGIICDGSWDDVDCWRIGGTATPAGVSPGSSDAVVFKTGSFYSTNSMIDNNYSVASITMQTGYTGYVYMGASYTMTVSGNVSVSGGQIQGNGVASYYDINGSLTLSGGNFHANTGSADVALDIIVSNTQSTFTGSSGSVTVGRNLTVSAGTFNSTTGVMSIGTSFTVGTGANFNPFSGTVAFVGTGYSVINVDSTETFYNLTLNKSSSSQYLYFSDANGDTINVLNILTLSTGKLVLNNNAELIAEGTLNWLSSFSGNYSTSYRGYLTIKTSSDVVIPNGQTNIPSLRIDNTNKSDLKVSTGGSTAMSFQGYFNMAAGTGTGATFENLYSEMTFTTTVYMYNGIVDLGSSNTHVFEGGTYIYGGVLNSGGSTNITHNLLLTISGGIYNAENKSSITFGTSAELDIKSGTMDATYASWVILNSIATNSFDFNGGTFKAPNAVGHFYINGGLDQEAAANFIHNNGAITFVGSGTSYIYNSSSQYYYDVVILKSALANEVQINTALRISNNLTISKGTLRVMSSAWTIYLSGDFINNIATESNFVHGNGSVVLNGLGQVLYGNNNFYNLTKSVITSASLVFTAGTTQTVVGTLTLTGGSSSSRLELISSSGGTRWNINPQGSRVINYVDVRDSNNTNAAEIDASSGTSIDSGNNLKWDFGDNYYWVGSELSCDGSWNDNDCWSNVSGGSGGVSALPGVDSIVYFDSADTASCTVDVAVSVAQLYLFTGYTGSVSTSSSYSITTSGGFIQYAGTFNLNGATLTSGGNVNLSGGTFNAGSHGNVVSTGVFYYNYFAPRTSTANFGAASTLDINDSFYFGSSSGGSGTFTAPLFIEVASSFETYAGSTSVFDANGGKVTFDSTASGSYIYNGVSFNNVEVDKGSGTFTVSADMDVNGDLLINSGTLAAENVTLYVDGNWGNVGEFTASTSTVNLGGNSQMIAGNTTFNNLTKSVVDNVTLTFVAGSTQTIKGILTLSGSGSVNKLNLRSSSVGTRWNINPQSSKVISYVDVKDSNNTNVSVINVSGTGSVDSGNNVNWNFGDNYFWVGSFTGCDGSWNDNDCWSNVSGGSGGVSNLPGPNSVVTFNAADTTACTIDEVVNVSQIYLQSNYTGPLNADPAYAINVAGFVQYAGTFNLNGGDLTVSSIMYLSGGTFNAGTGSDVILNGTFTFNYYSPRTATANFAGADLFDVNGNFYYGSVSGGGGDFTAPVSMNLAYYFYSYAETTNTFIPNGGTVVFDGSSYYFAPGGKIINFNDVIINKSSTFGLTGDLYVDGNLTIASGTLSAASSNIYLGGNWTNAGNFNAGTGTVDLGSESQTISGNTTFYNLTKTVFAAQTLTFDANSTQTVADILTLNGASGNPLSLVSSTPGVQWKINPQSSRVASYLNVSDSNNINATILNVEGTGSSDLGNNTNWNFGDKYWVGSYGSCLGLWSDINCWSSTSGGNGGTAVPGAGDQVYFDSGDTAGCEMDTNINIKGWVIDTGYTGYIDGSGGYTITVGSGRFLQKDGTVDLNGMNMVNTDNFYVYGGDFYGSGNMSMQALYFNYFEPRNGNLSLSTANVTVNGPLVLGSNTAVSSGTFTAPSANMDLYGSLYAYAGNTTAFNANNGTVTLRGSSAINYNYNAFTFNDLTINMSNTVSMLDNLNVDGDLNLLSGFLSLGSKTLNLAGDFNKTTGVLISGTGSVVLDGASQAINGYNSFYNLTKQVSNAATLTFQASKTQDVTGALTLNGADGQLLSLRSSSPSTQWSINPSSTRSVAYLDVQDSYNTNVADIDVQSTGSLNSGNNNGWLFDSIVYLYSDAFGVFNGSLFAGVYDTTLAIYTKLAPYTTAWSLANEPSVIDRIMAFATFKGNLYAAGNGGGTILKRSDTGFDLVSSGDMTNGIYTYMVVSYDKDAETDNLKLYMDGSLADTLNATNLLDVAGLDLLLGNSYGSTYGGSNASGEEYFDGEIDEFRISGVVRDTDWISTSYNNMSSPATFAIFGGQEVKPLIGGGGSGTAVTLGSNTAIGVSSSIGAGTMSIVSNGVFSTGINLSVSTTSPFAQTATWTWDEPSDYFSYNDASSGDGFHVDLYMSSSDAGNFVYSGGSVGQANIPVSNFSIYGGYDELSGSTTAPSVGVDDIAATLNIDSDNSCVDAQNLSYYTFNTALTTGPDFGMSLSDTPQVYLSSSVPCMSRGSFDIRRVKFVYPPGAAGGSYSSTMYIVFIDG